MLQVAEQKTTREESEKKALEDEFQQLQACPSPSNEAAPTIQGELITLETTMRAVY